MQCEFVMLLPGSDLAKYLHSGSFWFKKDFKKRGFKTSSPKSALKSQVQSYVYGRCRGCNKVQL